ncbi:MAG TPA: serine hydroxymethyltransferase, partial [Cryomorphaceae bacterium]|nr:serine hydroxymethyltransferase [Cryomorphaceae bacterium]
DDKSPFVTSGIRLGTPAITTRGCMESDMDAIAGFIDEVLMKSDSDQVLKSIGEAVVAMMKDKPLFA